MEPPPTVSGTAEVQAVWSWKTTAVSHVAPLVPPPRRLVLSSQSARPSVSSGRRLGLDLLRHLLGTVVGQAQAHDGQHHRYLVDGAVLRLHLHLTGYLSLQGGDRQRSRREEEEEEGRSEVGRNNGTFRSGLFLVNNRHSGTCKA